MHGLDTVTPAAADELLPTGTTARRLLAGAAIVAPLAHLAWVLSISNFPTDPMTDTLSAVQSQPGRFEISILTQSVFGLVGVPSALVLGAAVRR